MTFRPVGTPNCLAMAMMFSSLLAFLISRCLTKRTRSAVLRKEPGRIFSAIGRAFDELPAPLAAVRLGFRGAVFLAVDEPGFLPLAAAGGGLDARFQAMPCRALMADWRCDP